MFQQLVVKVLRSRQGQDLIDLAVRRVIEDQSSSTRAGLMRVTRAVVKDQLEDNRTREHELLELDAGYQEWAQQRREAMLADQAYQKALAHEADRSQLLDAVERGALPSAADPMAGYVTDAIVRVREDSLFEGRVGRVLELRTIDGWPEVVVLLEGHTLPCSFMPGTLELLGAVALPSTAQVQDQAPTQMIPTIEP